MAGIEYKKCKDCGKEFYINAKDMEFFKTQNFIEPKRCYHCRKARKAARERNELAETGQGSRTDTDTDTNSGNGSGEQN